MKIENISKKISNNYENATNTPTDSQLTAINNQISQIYNMDVEAIRNLGAISKSLLTGTNYHTTTPTTPGTLTIPADNTILKGELRTLGNIHTAGSVNTPWVSSTGGIIGNLKLSDYNECLTFSNGTQSIIKGEARLIIHNKEKLYLIPKEEVIIHKSGSWGSSGNLHVQGNLTVDGNNNLPLLGVGQTWRNMWIPRNFDTTYRNTTGRPIYVKVVVALNTWKSNPSGARFVIDAMVIDQVVNYGGGASVVCLSAIVPNNSNYIVYSKGDPEILKAYSNGRAQGAVCDMISWYELTA